MDAKRIKWLTERFDRIENEFEFFRGELRAIKALVGGKYASDTEAGEKEKEAEEA